MFAVREILNTNLKKIIAFACLLVIAIVFFSLQNHDSKTVSEHSETMDTEEETPTLPNDELIETNISAYTATTFDSRYRFSFKIPEAWAVQYIPETEAINIYNPSFSGEPLEQSQIFIRFFESDRFLTLQTVEIVTQENTTVNGHATVRYQIKKHNDVPNFPNQPVWRNDLHTVVDVRLSQNSPTYFYVIGKNPDLSEELFAQFLESLTFYNDRASYVTPLENAGQRVTKKPFGIYITPETSPVSPERFSGYHSGTDLEILPGEENIDVSVAAVCGGRLVQKRIATGYGGLAVQECELDGQTITVIYGHLRMASIAQNPGDYIAPGQSFAVLGTGYSNETDGERKHLHLGIHRGNAINIRGYEQSQSALAAWLDAATLLGF